MFTMKLNSIIAMLVDHSLDRKTSPVWNDGLLTRKGICINVRLSADKYEGERKSTGMVVYILFCGKTSVFWAPAYDKAGKYAHSPLNVPVENWVNTSNHDSCWRDDGLSFLNKMYFDFCEDVDPKSAPKEVDTNADFFRRWPINDIMITYKSDGDYRNSIVKLENA